MVARRDVPKNVKRALWAESMGYCMNPECYTYLLPDASIGEMAHIVPHSDGGDMSVDNLILLCRNCHQSIDGTRTEQTVDVLRQWKSNRNQEIRQKFAKKCASFAELQDSIVPLLTRSGEIFDDYGPATQISENHSLWLKFEPEIIANNAQISEILRANRSLFDHQNRTDVVDAFVKHAVEFANTRGDHRGHRVNLFPAGLRSVFGIEPYRMSKPVSNLSALQNFISHLVQQGRLRGIQLEPDPILFYVEDDGREEMLYLDDESRVRQVYWSGRFYDPKTTEVRLEGLTFFLEWLSTNSILYEFPDIRNLTELVLNRETPLAVFYEYCLSVSTLHNVPIRDGLIVVNLHNWNGAPVSQEAAQYAESVGIKVFSQNAFFAFAHRNLK